MADLCPACSQGLLRRQRAAGLGVLRAFFGASFIGFGLWGMTRAVALLDRPDPLLWILQFFVGIGLGFVALVPVAIGVALLWRPPVYQCSHCWATYRSSWLGRRSAIR